MGLNVFCGVEVACLTKSAELSFLSNPFPFVESTPPVNSVAAVEVAEHGRVKALADAAREAGLQF